MSFEGLCVVVLIILAFHSVYHWVRGRIDNWADRRHEREEQPAVLVTRWWHRPLALLVVIAVVLVVF